MSPRDLVYVGHMLDMAKKAVTKTAGLECLKSAKTLPLPTTYPFFAIILIPAPR